MLFWNFYKKKILKKFKSDFKRLIFFMFGQKNWFLMLKTGQNFSISLSPDILLVMQTADRVYRII